MSLAQIYMRAGKQSDAARELRAVARIEPGNVEAHRRLASLYRDAGYLDREYESLRSVAANAPGDWQTRLRIAEIALDVGWTDVAGPMLEGASRLAPQEPRLMMDLASLDFLNHQWPQMEQRARQGLKLAPDNAALWVVLSEACRLQKRLPEAEAALRDAIGHTADPPGLTRRYAKLAHLLLEPGWRTSRTADAERAARTALQYSPGDLEARYWLGRAQELQGRPAEAKDSYAQAAKIDIQFESVAFFLGRIYQRSQDPAVRREGERLLALYRIELENGKAYDRAFHQVKERAGDPAVHRTMAAWYLKSSRVPEAILELRRVLEMDGHDSQARKLLRIALAGEGRLSEAKQL
jgi:cytochrome c-type biogenesis protein CcmH/NrfG